MAKRRFDYEAIKRELQKGTSVKEIKAKFGCLAVTINYCRSELIGERNALDEARQKAILPKGRG
jgi:hypothetical protein